MSSLRRVALKFTKHKPTNTIAKITKLPGGMPAFFVENTVGTAREVFQEMRKKGMVHEPFIFQPAQLAKRGIKVTYRLGLFGKEMAVEFNKSNYDYKTLEERILANLKSEPQKGSILSALDRIGITKTIRARAEENVVLWRPHTTTHTGYLRIGERDYFISREAVPEVGDTYLRIYSLSAYSKSPKKLFTLTDAKVVDVMHNPKIGTIVSIWDHSPQLRGLADFLLGEKFVKA